MSLIREKDKVLELVEMEVNPYQFDDIDLQKETYYMPYTEAKHIGSKILEYNSSDVPEVKSKLEKLWHAAGNPGMDKYVQIALVAIKKCSNNPEGKFRDIDLFNYMM